MTNARERKNLGKHIGDFLNGVRILYLDFRIQTDSVTKLIEVKSVTSGNVRFGFDFNLFLILLIIASLSKKKRSLTGNGCVRWNILRSVNKSVVSPACILVILTFFANGSPRASGSNTSMTMSQRLSLHVHSNRSRTSTDTIPTSVLLCETAIPFSQVYDADTNMWLPSVHNTPPEVDFESDAKSASWTIPEDTQMLYSLHGNIACTFQCDGCKQSVWTIVCRKFCSILHRSCQIVESMRCQACQYVQDTDIGELFGLIRTIIFQLSSILPLSRIDDLPYMEWTFWTNGQSSCWQLDPCLSMSLHVIRSWCDIVVWLHPALEWINCGHRHECPKLILFLFRIPSIPDPAADCVLLDPLWPFSTLPSNFASCQPSWCRPRMPF